MAIAQRPLVTRPVPQGVEHRLLAVEEHFQVYDRQWQPKFGGQSLGVCAQPLSEIPLAVRRGQEIR